MASVEVFGVAADESLEDLCIFFWILVTEVKVEVVGHENCRDDIDDRFSIEAVESSLSELVRFKDIVVDMLYQD